MTPGWDEGITCGLALFEEMLLLGRCMGWIIKLRALRIFLPVFVTKSKICHPHYYERAENKGVKAEEKTRKTKEKKDESYLSIRFGRL